MSEILQNAAVVIDARVTYRRRFEAARQPMALVILYIILAHQDDSALDTMVGRKAMRTFIVQQLFPRLKRRTDRWAVADDPSGQSRTSIAQAFAFLHAAYIWLGSPPGHPWVDGSIEPFALSYLLHDDPEVLFWERHSSAGLNYTPWVRNGETTCPLSDLQYDIIQAKWHIGHKAGEYGFLNVPGQVVRALSLKIEQVLRLTRISLN